MHTLFSYLDLPVIPKYLEQMVLDAKDDVHLEEYSNVNKKEVYGTKVALVPGPVEDWIRENIFTKLPKNVNENQEYICIHRHYYIDFTGESWGYKYTNTKGIIPMHKDFGRHYGINYTIDTGGENVYTAWWDDNFKELQRTKIEPSRWAILSTKVLHGVDGIEPNRNRISIGLNWDPEDLESFDIKLNFTDITC